MRKGIVECCHIFVSITLKKISSEFRTNANLLKSKHITYSDNGQTLDKDDVLIYIGDQSLALSEAYSIRSIDKNYPRLSLVKVNSSTQNFRF